MGDIHMALNNTLRRVAAAALRRTEELQYFQPRLVAVSKTKPIEDIIAAYECGQRHFGENYVKELAEKSADPKLIYQCPDIKWHFIGHLQTNKINKILGVNNLYMVETIDSIKLAENVNKALKKLPEAKKLRVYVQVNASKEENKNGCEPSQATDVAEFIIKSCDLLEFCGLMTIGSYEHSYELSGDNPDFIVLKSCKTTVCDRLGLDPHKIELSMGMSSDFEHAIEMGSNSVRVGSLIFGARKYPQEDGNTH